MFDKDTLQALDMHSVKDKLKAFTIVAPKHLLRDFHRTVRQRNLMHYGIDIPHAYAQVMADLGDDEGEDSDGKKDSAAAKYESLDQDQYDAAAVGLYFYIFATLPTQNDTLVEEHRTDNEDVRQKKFSVLRLKHNLCEGVLMFYTCIWNRNESYRHLVLVDLPMLHNLKQHLKTKIANASRQNSADDSSSTAADDASSSTIPGAPAPDKPIINPAKTTRLINLSQRKLHTKPDAIGEWRIFLDAGLSGANNGVLDFIWTIKMRTELNETVAITSTRLPPLPEEEDDVMEPIQLTPLKAVRGHLGPALYPRDPAQYKHKLPKPRVTGTQLESYPELAQKIKVDVVTKSDQERHEPQLKIKAKKCVLNMDMSSRDDKFNQYVTFHFAVANLNDDKSVSIESDEVATFCRRLAEGSEEEEVTQRLGFVAAGMGRFPQETVHWTETDLNMPPGEDAMVAVGLTIPVNATEYKPGSCNMTRQRLHPSAFDRGISFNVKIVERRSGAIHNISWQPAAPAVTYESAADVAKKWGCSELCNFVYADEPAECVRHYAGCYIDKEDGFVIKRDGSSYYYNLNSLNDLAWDVTKAGTDEHELTHVSSTSTHGANFRAFVLIDRSEFPPIIYGVRLEIATAGNMSCNSCLIDLPGDRSSWITAPKTAADGADDDDSANTGNSTTKSLKSDLDSLRSQLGSWILVDDDHNNDQGGQQVKNGDAPHLNAMEENGTKPATQTAKGSSASAPGKKLVRVDADTGEKTTVIYHELLGAGAYGSVYKAFDNQLGKFIAVKETEVTEEPSVQRSILHEFSRLTQLRHKNIVNVHGLSIDEEDQTARVFMEWMPAGSVASVLKSTGHRLHESVIRQYVRDALEGLAYLHSQNIVHLDIKPANMLCTAEGVVKLGDFGTSKALGNGSTLTTTQAVGTPAYMPPEMISGGKYYQGSDMWSLACAIVELASGRAPWHHLPQHILSNYIPLMFHIGNAQPPNHCPLIPEHLSKDLKRILERCFAPTIAARPSPATLLADAYFQAEELPADAEPFPVFQRQVSSDVSGFDSCSNTDTVGSTAKTASLNDVAVGGTA